MSKSRISSVLIWTAVAIATVGTYFGTYFSTVQVGSYWGCSLEAGCEHGTFPIYQGSVFLGEPWLSRIQIFFHPAHQFDQWLRYSKWHPPSDSSAESAADETADPFADSERIQQLRKSVADENAAAMENVKNYVPQALGRIDALDCSAATFLRGLPGVVEVHGVPVENPAQRIVHLRDRHFIYPEMFAESLRQIMPRPLSDQEVKARYEEFLLELELLRLEQVAMLRCLIRNHGLRQVFAEGLTGKLLPEFRKKIEYLRELEAQLPELETKQLAQRRLKLLEIGAAGQLLLSGELESVLPLDDSRLLDAVTPFSLEGASEQDPAEVDAREAAQLQRVLKHGTFALIVLDGAHDLTDNLADQGIENCEYLQITGKRWLSFSPLKPE